MKFSWRVVTKLPKVEGSENLGKCVEVIWSDELGLNVGIIIDL